MLFFGKQAVLHCLFELMAVEFMLSAFSDLCHIVRVYVLQRGGLSV